MTGGRSPFGRSLAAGKDEQGTRSTTVQDRSTHMLASNAVVGKPLIQNFFWEGRSGGRPKKPRESHRLAVARARLAGLGSVAARGRAAEA
jgi:hypothetical protein